MTYTLEQLEQVVERLPEKDRGFAQDLIAKGRRYGLSARQAYWVNALAQRVLDPQHAEPEPPRVAIAFDGIAALFDRAAANLKYPKIHLQTERGLPVVLARAGDRSKFPGSITVTDGGPYGANRYYGRIHKGGMYEPARVQYGERSDVVAVLQALADDPVGVATKHGHLTGRCCFCNMALTDERSTRVGYGPTCAKNYGLPWGKLKLIADNAA